MRKNLQLGRRIAVCATALMLMFSLPVLAQGHLAKEGSAWVDHQEGSLPFARVLRVNADVGTIAIETGGQGFHYFVKKRSYVGSEQEARKQFEMIRVTAGHEGDSAVVRLTGSQKSRGRFFAEIVIQAPRNLDLVQVETLGGSINVQPISAKLQLSTRGGSIMVFDAGSQVTAETMGGNVDIKSAGGDVYIKTGGGNVTVGRIRGRLDIVGQGGNINVDAISGGNIQTGGGSIMVNRSDGDLHALTSGGSVMLGDMTGTVRAETGGGNIRVGSARGTVVAHTGGGNVDLWKLQSGAQVQSGAGRITAEFVGNKGAFADSSLRTAVGDVLLYLKNTLSVNVRAVSEMTSGRGIKSEFPELRISSEGGDYGPKSMYVEGNLNGGGPTLKARTTIGQIVIRRAQ